MFTNTPILASRPLANDVWYCIEEHWKLNTPGVADGALELWVDGVQTFGYYNQTFRGTLVSGSPVGNSSNMTFDEFQVIRQLGTGTMYWDEFAIGTTRIGCSGNPSADTTPPRPPVGLKFGP